MEIKERMVQITEGQNTILINPSFEVNMRLFNASDGYKFSVLVAIDHMIETMHKDFDNYPEIKGISGANVGIPYKIIVVKKKNDVDLVMINPKIIRHSKKKVKAKTNCGSVNLCESIEVKRYCWVIVEYYNRKGSKCCEKFDREHYGFTIQHEIDHVNGILITDKGV